MDVTFVGIVMLSREPQYANALFSMEVTLWGITTSVSASQLLNAFAEIVVRAELDGQGKEEREVHPLNALLPIEVTADGKSRLSSELQSLKRPAGIAVIMLGRVADSSAVQPAKAYSPITETLSGIVTVLRETHL